MKFANHYVAVDRKPHPLSEAYGLLSDSWRHRAVLDAVRREGCRLLTADDVAEAVAGWETAVAVSSWRDGVPALLEDLVRIGAVVRVSGASLEALVEKSAPDADKSWTLGNRRSKS